MSPELKALLDRHQDKIGKVISEQMPGRLIAQYIVQAALAIAEEIVSGHLIADHAAKYVIPPAAVVTPAKAGAHPKAEAKL